MSLTRTITTAGAKPGRIRQDRKPLTFRRFMKKYFVGIIAILASIVVFIVPFAFIFVTAAKNEQEASLLEFSLPQQGWQLWQNVVTVFSARDFILVTAFINSTILTVASVALMVVLAAMVGFVLQRRKSRWNALVNFFVLAGLIVPPAVVPTIWVIRVSACSRPCPG